ncbi:hypothetical protein WD019_16720 [Fictibacillus sp. Mic-4]|uniref:hypothetical protein n=1 Tax=Fictibacillus sp. Mic-4 TaxID=3132826 RepID=UPI003CF3A535
MGNFKTAFLGNFQLRLTGDVFRVVTKEEQENRERMLSPKTEDQKTVITAEEQNIVENSSTLSGFMEQENGQGFFFKKE